MASLFPNFKNYNMGKFIFFQGSTAIHLSMPFHRDMGFPAFRLATRRCRCYNSLRIYDQSILPECMPIDFEKQFCILFK